MCRRIQITTEKSLTLRSFLTLARSGKGMVSATRSLYGAIQMNTQILSVTGIRKTMSRPHLSRRSPIKTTLSMTSLS